MLVLCTNHFGTEEVLCWDGIRFLLVDTLLGELKGLNYDLVELGLLSMNTRLDTVVHCTIRKIFSVILDPEVELQQYQPWIFFF